MRCLDYFYARIKRPRNAQLFLGYEGWLAWLELRGEGDGEGVRRREDRGREGGVCVWVGYPKSSFCLVVWWGWWGHHAPHAKPPSFTSFLYKYMYISTHSFSLSLPLFSLSVVFPLLVFFVLAARVVLCWLRVRHSTYGGRCVRFFDKIQKKGGTLSLVTKRWSFHTRWKSIK